MSVPQRRTGYATGAVLAAAAGSLLVCHLLAPAWSRGAGLDVWNLWAERDEYQSVVSETEGLEQNFDRLQQQISANEWLVREVAAGRVALPAAADRLGEINEGRAGYLFSLRTLHPTARTDRQVYARQVIAMAARNGAPAADRERLEREYRDIGE